MKHDDIVLELTDEKLTLLLCDRFGSQGNYSAYHYVINEEIGEWSLNNVKRVLDNSTHNGAILNLNVIQKAYKNSSRLVEQRLKKDSLLICKTIEFPLIKGNNQYKTTKGFIDLIVHCQPFMVGKFMCYNDEGPVEFVIEIKKEKDFKDFGNILRQIKEYKEYYNDQSTKRYCSSIIPYNTSSIERVFCVLSTKIPEKIKKLFKAEGILCLELNTLQEPKLEAYVSI